MILQKTNAERAAAGIPTLAISSCLTTLAQQHAERLATEDRLYHQDLQRVVDRCDLGSAGENAVMNYTGPAEMVDLWMASDGHRANILNRQFTLIGIGVARTGAGTWYGVQVFGDRP